MSFCVTALLQMHTEPYALNENLARTIDGIDKAASAGADLIVLPELVASGYGLDREGLHRSSDSINGAVFSAWSEAAVRRNVFIVGGFCERADGKLYNSVLIIGPCGLVGHYRKLHLFDGEKNVFARGDLGLSVYSLPFANVGVCVCYDLRFVEVMRGLALQGAELIVVPTAWISGFDQKSRDASGMIGQARGVLVQANLNQVFVACASQCGTGGNLQFLGSSLVSDPYGELLAGPMAQDDEGMALAEIDVAVARAACVRSELIRPRQDRRTDIYGLVVGGSTY